jgi:hypothetical protein
MCKEHVVLRELSTVIAECYRLARECGDNARLSHDAKSNEIYSVMERQWIFLAQRYEVIERLKESPTGGRREGKTQD